ncbi:MAG: thioredoxin family protein [Dehalococcoidia bacterium]
MNIKILGPGAGCAKCHDLEKIVSEVVSEMGVTDPVERVSDMKEIMKYPIIMTPGLVINEELVLSGKVPSKADVTRHITNALAKE